tara:strand:+ start:516 stop:1103 length:588 start_codon:yes stop_codon:yes gene_type:complete
MNYFRQTNSNFSVTLIGGEPCTGKSTLMKKIIKDHKIDKDFEHGKLLKGHQSSDFVIAGLYEGQLFDGTDRLSMAVQPVFIDYIKKKMDKKHVLLEGDRLFKPSLIQFMFELPIDFRLIILHVDEEIKKQRHVDRGDNQTEKWLNAKKTTVNNIKNKFDYSLLKNNNEQEMEKAIDYIINRKRDKMVSPAQESFF